MNTKQRIKEYIEKRSREGTYPSIREIMRNVGLNSTSAVVYHLRKMDESTTGRRIGLPANWRSVVLDVLGNKCSRCGFSDKRALQIDHKNGGGALERKSMSQKSMQKKIFDEITSGDFSNYQLLCANCNWIKRHEEKELFRRSRA